MKKSRNKKQGIDPFYGKINDASVFQHALLSFVPVFGFFTLFIMKR